MSHFVVYVFTKEDGRDYEQVLAPYDENMIVAPYIKYTKAQAIASVREEIERYKNSTYAEYLADPKAYEEQHTNERHIKYLKEEFPKKLELTDEQCFEEKKIWFEDDMIDEEGNLWSTYNPNSKWDWYTVGGRWDKCLKAKVGFNVNTGYVRHIDWKNTESPFAFIDPMGKWHESGDMGWWGIVCDPKPVDEWERIWKQFIEQLDGDLIVTAVDCHI